MRNGWMKFMWPTWPMVGLQLRLAGQHAVSALAPGDPVESEPRLVVGEDPLDADLPHHAGHLVSAPPRSWPRRRLMPRAPTDRTPRAIRRRRWGPRGFRGNARFENICASSERSCRCCSVACSGTGARTPGQPVCRPARRTGIGDFRRTNAPCASASPRIRPCGIAIPCPSPVEPSFSRACRLSTTTFFASPRLASNSAPTASNRRAFEPASRSSRMFPAGSNGGDLAHFLGHGWAWRDAANPAQGR